MSAIYRCNGIDEFDRSVIIDKLKDIAGELELEQEKPEEERSREKEFKLIYRQFIEGLKLSTGYRQ